MDNSKNLMNNDKNLCLYCDKAFSNINDQGNHVERDHKTVLNKSKGSLRKSERITKNLCSENSPFAACFYCNNKKLIKSDDLESLFQHLLAAHKDIYFGCKCKTRLFDKVSLANHKKNCELGDSSSGGDKPSDEKISEKRKSSKASQSKGSVDLKCDNISDNTVINSTTAASNATNHSVKALPTNAINKKSDRSNVKNSNSKNVVNSNEKRNNNTNNHSNHSNKKSKISNISSSSSTTSSSSSSNKTIDEYTIPLTRQKLKEPTKQNRSSSNTSNKKVSSKTNRSSLSAVNENNNNKNASSLHASSSSTSSSSSSATKVQRTKTTKVINHNSQNNCELIENTQKNETLSTEFDEDFYKNISQNIRVNLNSFIDGKVDRLQLSRPVFDRISASSESTDGKQPNDIPDEKEIHEATNFELSTPFPALLTAEQYGFGDSNPKNKRQITKNSWKWKWDLIKKYKYVNEGGKIVKKVKQITTGLKDLSQLDMWTQLSMRSRYENLNNQNGSTTTEFDDGLNDSLSTRMIKTQNIEQLNSILDKRLIPEINIEQLQQTLVKEELVEPEEIEENINEQEDEAEANLLKMFSLKRTDTSKSPKTALSGEWARPRRFVCIDCGQEFDLMKSLNDHKNSEHPYVVSAHYEVVGRENLEHKLYKNLFLPKKALHAKTNADAKSISINSDSKSNEASSFTDNSSNSLSDQKEKECSKCMKMIKYSNDIDIYRHILDCIEDRVWMQAKRRNKYRRSRRKTKKTVKKPRLPIDQKKSTSSPICKENIEGDTSLSNPPTPKDDKKPIISINPKAKTETYVNDPKANTDGMNIKSFFRVSKTTPNLPQKIVVQMIEMHQNTHNNTLRHSLRSSTKKLSTSSQSITKNSTDTEEHDKTTESNATNSNDTCVKDETIIKEDEKSSTESTKTNQSSISPIPIDTIKTDIPTALTALQIPDADKMKSLLSPTNSSSSSLVSPTTSSVPKKKKKLNDCIAMLTCKIQEKLGVNFFENNAVEIFPPEVAVPKEQEKITSPTFIPLPMPSHQNIANFNPIPIIKIPDVPQKTFTMPEQDEVIDLSIKKRPSEDQRIPNKALCNKIETLNDNQSKPIEEVKPKVDDTTNCIPKCDEIIKIESTSEAEVKQIESPVKESEKCNEKSQEITKELTCVEENDKIQVNITELEPLKVEEITESFKISISKDRIPNLNEILENNSVITVNNLKISESERRAFEEQKNRIMQILNKTKKPTPTKKVAKKAPPKKQPAKKNVKQQQQNKNAVQIEKKQDEVKEDDKVIEPSKVAEPTIEIPKVEEPKENHSKISEIEKEVQVKPAKIPVEQPMVIIEPIKPNQKIMYKFPSESPERELEKPKVEEVPKVQEKPKVDEKPKETPIEATIQNKIEQAIKTTNRIRCRRLSVVVDPIIHLAPFQTNRKIRLTNNSQQNGLYDLLTNDQLFNAITPQLKDEIKKTCAKVANKAAKNIQNAINEVRAATAKATKEANKEKEQSEATSTNKNLKSKSKAKAKKKTASKYKKKKSARVNAKNNKTLAKKQPEKKIEEISNTNNSKKPPPKGKQPLKSAKVIIDDEKPVVQQQKADVSVVEVKPATKPQKSTPEPTVQSLKSVKSTKKDDKPAAKVSKLTKSAIEKDNALSQSSDSLTEDDIPITQLLKSTKPILDKTKSTKPIVEEEKPQKSAKAVVEKPKSIIKPSKLSTTPVKTVPPQSKAAASKSKIEKTPTKIPAASLRASTPLAEENIHTSRVSTPLPKEKLSSSRSVTPLPKEKLSLSRSVTPLPKEKPVTTSKAAPKGKQAITQLPKDTPVSSRSSTPLPKEKSLPLSKVAAKLPKETPVPSRASTPVQKVTRSPAKAVSAPSKVIIPPKEITPVQQPAKKVQNTKQKAPPKGKPTKQQKKIDIVEEPNIEIHEDEKKEEEEELKEPIVIKDIEVPITKSIDEKAEEKLSLDISLSSDTSNENDIPLAKLVSLSKEKSIKEQEEEEEFPKMQLNDKEPPTQKAPLKVNNNKKKAPAKKASKIKTQSKSRSKMQNKTQQVDNEGIMDDEKQEVPLEDDVKVEEMSIEISEKIDITEKNLKPVELKIEDEKPKKLTEHRNEKIKSSEIINAKAKIEKENMERMEVFNINEDSFFNDDNDADEKINDLVNNIINSSELVDSENEKNDNQQQNLNENQAEATCLICKRTFRNEKVLEKHNKTTTHLFKVKRREKRIAEQMEKEAKKEKEKPKEVDQKHIENQANATSSDETKIFRTKGALKTFENILSYPSTRVETIYDQPKDFKSVLIPEIKSTLPFNNDKKIINAFEFDDDDDNNEDLSRKDKIFDSLFSNIENKLQAAAAAAANNNPAPPLQKFAFPTLTPHDSEVESSSTSWDLKHDADIEWDADNNDNQTSITNAIKEKFPKKNSVKINKSKETAISIPTKSLIMGKIFKKHRDREKQKTPQADAPNNKPGIKNSLDEIFDHLKNSAEIDDKVLTCPSPKTLLKSSGGTFSPHSSQSNDMLETASQSNNNNNNNNTSSSNNNSSNNLNINNNNNMYSTKKPISTPAPDKSTSSNNKKSNNEIDELPKDKDTTTNDEEEDGIGKRKSRRRCAIKTKTFAETWSSDEYEELHDTNDIISIINEIEKRESIKKRKVSKSESHFVDNSVSKKNDEISMASDTSHNQKSNSSILKSSNECSATDNKKSSHQNDKKKSVQLQFPSSDIFSKVKQPVNTIRKRRMSTIKDGHKSDEETFTATKDLKPLKPTISMMKKRRMSCFVPSSIFNDNPKPQTINKAVKSSATEVLSKTKHDKEVEHKESLSDASEKIGKSQKKILSAVCNNNNNNNNNNSNSTITASSAAIATTTTSSTEKLSKKKAQKHRKRPRNKVKNIAYDSDSDFELNLSRKSKASAFSDSYSEEEEDGDEISHSNKIIATSQQNSITKSSNTNELTMIKEPKLLPNDLNVVPTTAPVKAAIPEDINDPSQSACNRTKRHSSEKLYYWSSSSESDVEPGDTADGENEDSVIPQQPEQHGWIVGDSHKKLVTLLAHAKIKNKIN